MIFYLLLCEIFFIPLIYSSNTTSQPYLGNKTLQETAKVNVSNNTKVTLLSEGGSILPESTVLALPKENHTILMSLDSDLGNNKVKPVVARKGVVYSEENTVNPEQKKPVPFSSNNSSLASQSTKKPDAIDSHMKNVTSIPSVNSTLVNKISSGTTRINTTETPKKPLILSYDSLANMPVKSSPETLNQIQSPNKALKVYAKNANSHPGMVMPIVITILLVPMFAVLGYMAIRRGQEAWKNRHYKRMDFLLDGMYND